MNAPIALPQLWQRLATERAELRGRVSREAPVEQNTCVRHAQHCPNSMVIHRCVEHFAMFPRFILYQDVRSNV